MFTVTPNNPMQRAGTHKLHAPDRSARFAVSACAQRALRAVADGDRWAARILDRSCK